MSIAFRLSWSFLCLFSVCLIAPPAAAATTSDLSKVNAHLKRAEDNLKLVDASIGQLSAPPKGSAAKLSKMRLDQAFGDLEPAGKLLASLAGTEAAEATARYNAAAKLYGKLQAILVGTPPEPTPAPDPQPGEKVPAKKEAKASGTVKLGYPHADNFKNVLFTLRRVEGDTAGLVKLLEQLRPVEDQLTIDHRTTASAMATITETRRQAGFVSDGMAKIPANGEGVAEAQQRLVNANASLSVTEGFFKPLNARLMDLVNPANYPDFRTDLKRLRELTDGYGIPESTFRERRVRAAEALAQGEAARAECIRIAGVYGRLMQQQTDQGKQIENAGNTFLERYATFLATAEQQKQALPGDIRADLAEADRMAKEAIEKQAPQWFNGGIPQRMGWVDDKFALYAVLDTAGAPALKAEIDSVKASIRAGADSLKELIIRENPLPDDTYAGGDRDAIIAVALDAWKAQEQELELLAVRIPSADWSRDTKWTYSSGTWYFIDVSYLQVRLIVADKQNPDQAIDRPVNVRKDHQKNDALTGHPLRNFGDPLQPRDYLLRTRIK